MSRDRGAQTRDHAAAVPLGYRRSGIDTADFADDSNGVNVHAFPALGLKLGMLLLNLGVWVYAAAGIAEAIMPF
jgi:hypothetical protein